MTIIILLDNDFTIDNRVRRTAETLTAQGYEVHLFATVSKNSAVPIEEMSGGIYIHRILEPTDFDYHLPQRWFRSVRKVLRILKTSPRPQVVHANDVYTLPMGWLLALLSGARLVYDSHEYWQATLVHNRNKFREMAKTQARKKYLRFAKLCQLLLSLEPWLIRQSSAVITVSESIAEALAKHQAPKRPKPVMIRNTAAYMHNTERVAKEKRYHREFGLSKDTRVILYQGVVKSGRGLIPVIRAMGQCRDMKAVLVMMGPVNKRAFLEELMAMAVPGTVFYKESVPASEIEEWTASADIGIVASPRCHDNFVFSLPNKFFSYIQSEVPILTNQLPEMARLLCNYRVGMMTNMSDEALIIETLQDMLRPEQLAEFRQCIAIAKEELCWEKERQVLINLYSEIAPQLQAVASAFSAR